MSDMSPIKRPRFGGVFLFSPLQYSHAQAFTARFAPSMQLYHPHHKTAHRALQGRILRYVPFYSRKYQTNTRGYNTACALIWIHARQCSIPQTMPARRGGSCRLRIRWQVLTHCQQYRPGAPAEGSASPPVQGQSGGAELLAATAVSLFGLSPDIQ